MSSQSERLPVPYQFPGAAAALAKDKPDFYVIRRGAGKPGESSARTNGIFLRIGFQAVAAALVSLRSVSFLSAQRAFIRAAASLRCFAVNLRPAFCAGVEPTASAFALLVDPGGRPRRLPLLVKCCADIQAGGRPRRFAPPNASDSSERMALSVASLCWRKSAIIRFSSILNSPFPSTIPEVDVSVKYLNSLR